MRRAAELSTVAVSLPDPRPWIALTRPRVVALATFTGLPALAFGPSGWPGPAEVLAILLCIAGVGAACSVLNAWWDRDIDARMERTRDRPIPSGEITPFGALLWGIVLSLVSIGALAVGTTVLAAVVASVTIAFYIGVYTMLLKRRTPQNIVIGGAAGAAAPLIADAAVNGTIGVGAWLLFLLITAWTPAHFWAIALYRREEYRAAGVPMLPVVVGEQPTRVRMLFYGLLTVGVTLLLPAFGVLGLGFALVSMVLGTAFLAVLGFLNFRRTDDAARSAFAASNVYLLLIFTTMILDLVGSVSRP